MSSKNKFMEYVYGVPFPRMTRFEPQVQREYLGGRYFTSEFPLGSEITLPCPANLDVNKIYLIPFVCRRQNNEWYFNATVNVLNDGSGDLGLGIYFVDEFLRPTLLQTQAVVPALVPEGIVTVPFGMDGSWPMEAGGFGVFLLAVIANSPGFGLEYFDTGYPIFGTETPSHRIGQTGIALEGYYDGGDVLNGLLPADWSLSAYTHYSAFAPCIWLS